MSVCKRSGLLLLVSMALLAGCTSTTGTETNIASAPANLPVPAGDAAYFHSFGYTGQDPAFATSVGENEIQNPILSGFHPDPSITRVGDDYYIVNSTFGYFPGLPIFKSRDLKHWEQIGNALDRPSQMDLQGVDLNNQGLYAPAIEFHDGQFYIINTCVECGGNFILTAEDAAGPWSDPIWLNHLQGIDPSLFFDDGKVYIVHHRNPAQRNTDSHTAIYMVEVDPATFEPVSEDVMLVDGGIERPWNTEWAEGPHIYKKDGQYVLSFAGGGTGYYHQQLIYRSQDIWGPYEPFAGNPILTQLGLPDDRANPITATGHSDFFEDGNGDWWVTFLATRPFNLSQGPVDPGSFYTGRETFLLPVTWKDGVPHVLPAGTEVPYRIEKPDLPAAGVPDAPTSGRQLTGNFDYVETFTESTLAPHWLFIRPPQSIWWNIDQGKLAIEPTNMRIGDLTNPSFIGQRVRNQTFTVTTQLSFSPASRDEEAGLAAVQDDEFYFAFGLSQNAQGETVVRLRERKGAADGSQGRTIAEQSIGGADGKAVWLRIEIDKDRANFLASTDGTDFTVVAGDIDATLLTTAVAGGFTGAVVGMYAQGS